MLDPFSFKFAIKFVDGDPSQNVFDLAATGDMTAVIIAAILAIVAATAGILYFARNRQSVMASAKSTLGSHVHMRGSQTSKGGSFALIVIAVAALALSLVTFIGSGSAKAMAEGQLGVPVVKAQVMDDGSVNINPIHLKNSHDTQIKVQSSRFETEAEAYFDEEMRAAHCQITGLDGNVYDGDANGEYYHGDAYGRIAPGEAGDFNVHICGLTAEKANSYLEQVVYVAEITFEDAVVPVPEPTEFVYDGDFHHGVEFDSRYKLLPAFSGVEGVDEDSVIYAQDVKRDSQDEDPQPYVTSVKLNPGFVWDDEDQCDEVKDIKWTINPATLTIVTENGEWDYDMNEHTAPGHVEGLQSRAFAHGYGEDEDPVVYVDEYVNLDTTFITHYYESAEADPEGLVNEGTITFPEARSESGEIPAKASNYSSEYVREEGHLVINQIQFKHELEDGTLAEGVYAPDQSYEYNAKPHGDAPKYCMLKDDESQLAEDY